MLVLISCGMIFYSILEYRKSNELYEETAQEYVTIQEDRSAEESEQNWWELAEVDLAGLSAGYPDVVGWIFFENEDISYPILYSGDNDKYLRRTYTGEAASAGSIFLDGESTPDFSDPHTLIYGHNMRNLSMFGKLKYYRTRDGYYENHQYFQIFTGNRVYRYRIFAYEEVPVYHEIYDVYGAQPQGFPELIESLKQNSYGQTEVAVDASDHVITLSTCSGGNTRMVVSGVRVDAFNELLYGGEEVIEATGHRKVDRSTAVYISDRPPYRYAQKEGT